MSTSACQVVKLGGSLLDFEHLEPHWWRWLRQSGCAQTIVLVGGGHAVDEMRMNQHARGTTDIEAHWAAVAAMGDNARRVAGRFLMSTDAGPVVTRLEQVTRALRTSALVFVDPLELLREDDSRATGTPLPCSWDVTSDSIAARIADLLNCPELTLLKSALPGKADTYSAAATQGYVDRYFPNAAIRLERVKCVNLRSPTLDSQVLSRDLNSASK